MCEADAIDGVISYWKEVTFVGGLTKYLEMSQMCAYIMENLQKFPLGVQERMLDKSHQTEVRACALGEMDTHCVSLCFRGKHLVCSLDLGLGRSSEWERPALFFSLLRPTRRKYISNWSKASAEMQNSKIISKPNPDISMTDNVAITGVYCRHA